MIVTSSMLHSACAALIHAVDPGVEVYDNPTPQKVTFPAWWVLHSSNEMEHEPCGRYWLVFSIELVYIYAKDSNDSRLFDRYYTMADALSANCDFITLTDGVETQTIHTYQHNWRVERDGLHFSLQIRLRASKPRAKKPVMQTIEDLTVETK